MPSTDELSRRELLALKEIRLTGRTSDGAIARQLLDDKMVVDAQGRQLELTAKGRRMLVRGSPTLWDISP